MQPRIEVAGAAGDEVLAAATGGEGEGAQQHGQGVAGKVLECHRLAQPLARLGQPYGALRISGARHLHAELDLIAALVEACLGDDGQELYALLLGEVA